MAAKKILVIGAGPGGYPAALKAAEMGAEVTLVERRQAGGVCLNWGCIPSKLFLDAAHLAHSADRFNGMTGKEQGPAGVLAGDAGWQRIIERKNLIVGRLKSSLIKLFDAKKIKYAQGAAKFVSHNSAEITGASGSAVESFDAAIIATGTKPFLPPPFDAVGLVLDNESVFSLAKMPRSVIIVGGGAIGVEFGCFFNAMGAKVDIVELMPSLLPGEDEAVCRAVQSSFEKRGITLHLGRKAAECRVQGGAKQVKLADGATLEADEILVSAGRVVDLPDLGLEALGVAWSRKGIKVDAKLCAGPENIYAAGDVNGLSLFAHAATRQGEIAAANALGAGAEYDNSLIPRCIYSWPEAASVGLSRKEAEAAGKTVKVRRAFFAASGRALAQDATEGFVQIVCGEPDGVVLGAQIVGHAASEMIHIFSVAIAAKMTAAQLKKVVFAHPTFSETISTALER